MNHLQFREGDNIASFEDAVKTSMQEPIEHFAGELKKLRTGRAHTALVEDMQVECYGNTMRLRDVATITAPDAQLIVIQPWDQNNLDDIERSIAQSNLGITPQNDGGVIRLRIAPMSADQREILVKTLGKKLEECKVAVRNIRKTCQNYIRDTEKAKHISEDTAKRLQASLQKITDSFTDQADTLSNKKEKEIKSI